MFDLFGKWLCNEVNMDFSEPRTVHSLTWSIIPKNEDPQEENRSKKVRLHSEVPAQKTKSEYFLIKTNSPWVWQPPFRGEVGATEKWE